MKAYEFCSHSKVYDDRVEIRVGGGEVVVKAIPLADGDHTVEITDGKGGTVRLTMDEWVHVLDVPDASTEYAAHRRSPWASLWDSSALQG